MKLLLYHVIYDKNSLFSNFFCSNVFFFFLSKAYQNGNIIHAIPFNDHQGLE